MDKAREHWCCCSRLYFSPLPVCGISALLLKSLSEALKVHWTRSHKYDPTLSFTVCGYNVFCLVLLMCSDLPRVPNCSPGLRLSTRTAHWHFRPVTTNCRVPFQRPVLMTGQILPLPEFKGHNSGISHGSVWMSGMHWGFPLSIRRPWKSCMCMSYKLGVYIGELVQKSRNVIQRKGSTTFNHFLSFVPGPNKMASVKNPPL